MKLLRIVLPVALLMTLLAGIAPAPARAEVDVYTTPGVHVVNGREWFTQCVPYSQTERCTTQIKATQVSQENGRFVQTTGWVFNNLTYAASPRSLWSGNPLGAYGVVGGKVSWTAEDGRRWRTECDTAVTGGNGCRSYIQSKVIESYLTSDGTRAFRWVTKEVFNNLVRFTTSSAPSQPTTQPAPTQPGRYDPEGELAVGVLADLAIKGRAPKTGYRRDQFGQRWADVDRNGCDTRNDILDRDLAEKAYRAGTNGCIVETGTLLDPFTATVIDFVRGTTTSTAVQIDHVVALSDAWQKGAQQLSLTTRTAFANDPLNLLAVDGPTNASKGDGDAATWLPPNKAFRCEYVARQVGVKYRYQLWITQAEHDAIAGILSNCSGQRIPDEDARPVVTAPPAPTTPPPDVYYANCDAVRAAGAAPLYRGEPGYRSGLDRDGDGVACEP